LYKVKKVGCKLITVPSNMEIVKLEVRVVGGVEMNGRNLEY
jgi:hypothetical protein